MNKLTEIANKHKTDKGTVYFEAHGYTEIYGKYISDSVAGNLLEIGIWHGDSIRMWNEYNQDLKIHAIDIDRSVLNYLTNGEDVSVYIGSQSDTQFLTKTLENIGDLDYVVDDGSHIYHDIVTSFDVIYPKLKRGGLYFIEDLHATNANFKGVVEYLINKNVEFNIINNKLIMVEK